MAENCRRLQGKRSVSVSCQLLVIITSTSDQSQTVLRWTCVNISSQENSIYSESIYGQPDLAFTRSFGTGTCLGSLSTTDHSIIIIPSPSRGWDLVLAWFHVHYYYPIPHKGMGSCSSLVSCTLLLFFFFFLS